jgi:hypothetical protein
MMKRFENTVSERFNKKLVAIVPLIDWVNELWLTCDNNCIYSNDREAI